jgi:hypothetical protein
MNKKNRQNQYKKDTKIPSPAGRGLNLYQNIFTIARIPALICLFSIAALFSYDVVVQSPFFIIKNVTISGDHKVKKQDILALAGLTAPVNIFQVNLSAMEKRITSHPWIAAASVDRSLFSSLAVSIVEQEPLAIVSFENLPDILINTRGIPFTEYDPGQDHIATTLPVITGLDLIHTQNQFQFDGPLFNAVLDLLLGQRPDTIVSINGDPFMGITIQVPDVFNRPLPAEGRLMPIGLGFGNYEKKLIKARKISQYITANIPGKTICAMDLFDIDTVFVKTTDMDVLHANIKKGV